MSSCRSATCVAGWSSRRGGGRARRCPNPVGRTVRRRSGRKSGRPPRCDDVRIEGVGAGRTSATRAGDADRRHRSDGSQGVGHDSRHVLSVRASVVFAGADGASRRRRLTCQSENGVCRTTSSSAQQAWIQIARTASAVERRVGIRGCPLVPTRNKNHTNAEKTVCICIISYVKMHKKCNRASRRPVYAFAAPEMAFQSRISVSKQKGNGSNS